MDLVKNAGTQHCNGAPEKYSQNMTIGNEKIWG
jgi:hypothetical protein